MYPWDVECEDEVWPQRLLEQDRQHAESEHASWCVGVDGVWMTTRETQEYDSINIEAHAYHKMRTESYRLVDLHNHFIRNTSFPCSVCRLTSTDLAAQHRNATTQTQSQRTSLHCSCRPLLRTSSSTEYLCKCRQSKQRTRRTSTTSQRQENQSTQHGVRAYAVPSSISQLRPV